YHWKKGTHINVGGATDIGKSKMINVIFNSLLLKRSEEVEFTLIDLKGGLELGSYKNIEQVKHFAKDVDTAKDALDSVQQYMSGIFETMEKQGKKIVKEAGINKRHFVIIDEAATLTSE